MSTAQQRTRPESLVPRLVDRIAESRGIDTERPDFCLYEEIDPEALTLLVESTDGPLTVQFEVDETAVTVRKTGDGAIDVEVDPPMVVNGPSNS